MFLTAPGDLLTRETCEAFMNVVAAFHAAYRGTIAVHGSMEREHRAAFARLNAALLPESAPVVPGWRAESIDLHEQPDIAAHAVTTGANVACCATGRLRLTGRAMPTDDSTIVRAWLVFECGTLAADPAAGTLGFGILEIRGDTSHPVFWEGANHLPCRFF